MNIFLLHYEYGYFEPAELVSTLQSAKTALRTVNQVNILDFVMFIYDWVRKFIKLALHDLIDRCYLEFESNKNKTMKTFEAFFP